MKSSLHWSGRFALCGVLVMAYGLKRFYATADLSQLDFVLRPTVALLELATASSWPFEAGVGYVSYAHHTAVAASCAGLNFTVAALLALGLCVLPSVREPWGAVRWLSFLMACSYGATVLANTMRILLDIVLRPALEQLLGVPGAAHRALGVGVYFTSLCLLCVTAEWIVRPRARPRRRGAGDREIISPVTSPAAGVQ